MLIILILIVNTFYSASCQYGVTLSVENSNSVYEGYLWNNNKIVFITPELKASVVKGISKSEKICGYELRKLTNEHIPFIVYLLDELSGVGEMQIKPNIQLDNQLKPIYEFTVEAFDCDSLPHYSRGAAIRIHVVNETGPIFYSKSYTFTVKRDAKIDSIVGEVKAKSTLNNPIEYSIQHDEKLPFTISQLGVITIRNSLINNKQSDFLIRVVAKEKSKGIPKQSLVLVNIEIEPACQNKLSDFPDQLDYHIKSGINNMMEAGQLIQQGHRPVLIICNLPSPLKEVTLKISLKKNSKQKDMSINKNRCPIDVPSARIQRAICGANPNTMDLLVPEGGLIQVNQASSVGPEIIDNLGMEFTLTWWIKLKSHTKTNIFCLEDNERKSTKISIENCQLIIINQNSDELKIEIPSNLCQLNDWQFIAISQHWAIYSTVKVMIGGSLLTNVIRKSNFFQFTTVKLFVGRCSDENYNSRSDLSGPKLDTRLELGVISITIDKTQKQDAIECLSSCGEAIVPSDSITKLSKIHVERQGSSLLLKSKSIIQLLDSPTKIYYMNSFFVSKTDSIRIFEPTDLWIDLSIECESKKIIKVPRAVMRINFIGPQKETVNDTVDVELYINATITATKSKAIHMFPDLRFINANTEFNTESIAKSLRVESCTIRLFERSLVGNERIHLPESIMKVLDKTKLEIKSNINQWTIEGEAGGEIYENILRNIQVDMVDERKKFTILCTLKGGDFTNQAIVEVIQQNFHNIHFIKDENSNFEDSFHQSKNEKSMFQDKFKEDPPIFLSISKSKFIGVIIMAVIGGAAWALVTAAVTCFILRRRESTIDRKKINNSKSYSKNNTLNNHQPPLMNTRDIFVEYEYEEDRNSMADIPDDEEQNLDNISCETCNMTDPEVIISSSKSVKDLPRSKTITFPIIHRKF